MGRKIICENPTHTNNWLRTSDLKKETEGFIIAAQDQALTTNFMKAAIHKTRSCANCRRMKLCFTSCLNAQNLRKNSTNIVMTLYGNMFIGYYARLTALKSSVSGTTT